MKLKFLTLPFVAFVLSLSTLVALPQQAKAVSAADWKAGRIIDDAVFFNKDSMSVQQIQDFLNAKVPGCDRWNPTRFTYAGKPYGPPYTCLKEYQENPTTKENNIGRFNPDGSPYNVPGGWSAAQIIKDASMSYGINPQVLIVMLQKETAIVTDTWAAGWQYDRAMGYGCPDNGPNNTANCNASYYGFYNQVGNAAWQLKRYTTNPNEYNFKAGVTRNILWQVGGVCGSSPVYIENAATAALYNYTPYQPNQAALNNLYGTGDGCSAYGNRNFWRLFNDWFGSSSIYTPYAWQYISQMTYLDDTKSKAMTSEDTILPGGDMYISVKARNIGYNTWQKQTVRIGTSRPTERPTLFSDQSWIGPTRPSALLEEIVTPGNIGTFEFKIKAPNTPGSYKEYFNILAEGVTWFNDPGLQFNINVVEQLNGDAQNRVIIEPGTQINKNEYILGPYNKSRLVLSRDGSLNYDVSLSKNVWRADASGPSAQRLIFQTDGNLVLYDNNNNPLWSSLTAGNIGSKLIFQSDGNLVLYDSDNRALWATHTVHYPEYSRYATTTLSTGRLYKGQAIETANRKYRLILQTDGNLVLYDNNNRALWASWTDGKKASFLAMQPDGNLVLYDNEQMPIWSTHTSGKSTNARLIVQPDGNLVLYSGAMTPLWNTQTVVR